MKRAFCIIGVVVMSFGAAGSLSAQETLIETVANGWTEVVQTIRR